ncbi:MAG: isochorismatase family cysteine hydrolase [Thermoanaerobaculia bacterium]
MLERTALLIIDPYNDFISDGGKLWLYGREVAERVGLIDNMSRLLTAARELDMLVVYVPHRQFEEGDLERWKFLNPTHAAIRKIRPFVRGSWGAEFHPRFVRQEGELMAQQHWLHSGFANTDLDMLLRAHGIDQVVLCGMRANTCIEGTARYAVELGYHVTIARDATAAFRWEEWQATMEANAPTFAHAIAPAEEIVRGWNAQTREAMAV